MPTRLAARCPPAPPQPRTSGQTAAPAAWRHGAPRWDRGQTFAAPMATGVLWARSSRAISTGRCERHPHVLPARQRQTRTLTCQQGGSIGNLTAPAASGGNRQPPHSERSGSHSRRGVALPATVAAASGDLGTLCSGGGLYSRWLLVTLLCTRSDFGYQEIRLVPGAAGR